MASDAGSGSSQDELSSQNKQKGLWAPKREDLKLLGVSQFYHHNDKRTLN